MNILKSKNLIFKLNSEKVTYKEETHHNLR